MSIGALALLLTACGGLKPRHAAPPSPEESVSRPGLPPGRIYHVDEKQSELRVLVYRAGPLARFGHNHVIVNHAIRGVVSVAEGAGESVFRLNLPVLFATVFISNPFTWLPQVAGSIWVGARLMGLDLMPMMHELHHRHLWAQVSQLWAPLLLGALVLGLVAAGSGYVLAQFAWRARVLYHLRRRRIRSTGRSAALD